MRRGAMPRKISCTLSSQIASSHRNPVFFRRDPSANRVEAKLLNSLPKSNYIACYPDALECESNYVINNRIESYMTAEKFINQPTHA